jgi:hypothetical protein
MLALLLSLLAWVAADHWRSMTRSMTDRPQWTVGLTARLLGSGCVACITISNASTCVCH